MFTLVYALEEAPAQFSKSVFLAGPSVRRPGGSPWRNHAITQLREVGYDGVVFIPEPRPGARAGSDSDRAMWEEQCLGMSDCVLLWVPLSTGRNAPMQRPDVGLLEGNKRVVVGSADKTFVNSYMVHYTETMRLRYVENIGGGAITVVENIGEGAVTVSDMLENGAHRIGGERHVPLHIWQTTSFQAWYRALKAAGNHLDSAKEVWTFCGGPDGLDVFFWALQVRIYVAAEGRHKTNEVVLSRPDISTVVLYRRAQKLDDSVIVLIREFRSPTRTDDGYVREVPGGSSFDPDADPLQLAIKEVKQETGLVIGAKRLRAHGARQLVATVSAHQAYLFSAEITERELQKLRSQAANHVVHGVEEESERTFVEITTLGEIRAANRVDWSMLGMITQVLLD